MRRSPYVGRDPFAWGCNPSVLPVALPPEMLAFTATGQPYSLRQTPRTYAMPDGTPVVIGNMADVGSVETDLLVNPFGKIASCHRPLGRNVLYGVPPGTTDPRKATPDAYDAGQLGSRGRLNAVGTFRISSSAATWKYIRRVESGDSNRLIEQQEKGTGAGSQYGGGNGGQTLAGGASVNTKVPPEGELPSSDGDNEVLFFPKNATGTIAQAYAQFRYRAENPACTEASARGGWEYDLEGHDTRDTWVSDDSWGPSASEIRLHSGVLLASDFTGSEPIRKRLYATATATSITAAVRAEHHVLSRKNAWPAWGQDSPHQTLNGVPDNSGDIPYGTIICVRWFDYGLRETLGLTDFGKRLFDCLYYFGCTIGDRQGQVVNDQAVIQLRADDTLGSNATNRTLVNTELQKILPHLWPVFNVRKHDAGDASERWVDGDYYIGGGGPIDAGSINSAWNR